MAAAAIAAVALSRRRSAITNNCSGISCLYTFFSKSHHSYYASSFSHFSTVSTKIPPSQIAFTPDFFLQKYQFSPELASTLASASARMKNPQNPDLLLSFLKRTGFTHSHLERIVRHHPVLLSACVETGVKPKFSIFHDLGFSADEVTQLVSRNFSLLHRAENTIIHTLSVLKGVLGSNENVIELIKRYPGMFYANPEKTILPNIEYLKSCGLKSEQVNTCIYSLPTLFFLNPENVRRCVYKADEMGVLRSSKMFIRAVKAISDMSGETFELKLKSLQDLGFSDDGILRLLRSTPVVLALSAKKINEVKEVLLETEKYDMSCIVKSPLSLGFSVEKRYKPRLQVLKVLESRSLIDKWPSLATLCTMSNKSFFERFVAPNMKQGTR